GKHPTHGTLPARLLALPPTIRTGGRNSPTSVLGWAPGPVLGRRLAEASSLEFRVQRRGLLPVRPVKSGPVDPVAYLATQVLRNHRYAGDGCPQRAQQHGPVVDRPRLRSPARILSGPGRPRFDH